MLQRRLQILIDEPRYQKLAREAQQRRVSIAALIRDAIDRLDQDQARRRRAVDALLAAEPMPVPADPADLNQEIDAIHRADV